MADTKTDEVNWTELKPQLIKMALELGPLVVFYVANARADMPSGTRYSSFNTSPGCVRRRGMSASLRELESRWAKGEAVDGPCHRVFRTLRSKDLRGAPSRSG